MRHILNAGLVISNFENYPSSSKGESWVNSSSLHYYSYFDVPFEIYLKPLCLDWGVS